MIGIKPHHRRRSDVAFDRATGRVRFALAIVAAAMVVGCSTEESREPLLRPCDTSRVPVVMAHGFLASGDTWSNHASRFSANGFCIESLHAFDYNSLFGSSDTSSELDAFVDSVRQKHGAAQVDLFGHSAGGQLGYSYLSDASRASKVRRYVHIGSGVQPHPAGPEGARVPTLNVWSEGDLVVAGGDIESAQNVSLADRVDHYAVATSESSFEAIYPFLAGEPPSTSEPVDREQSIVLGRAVTLGENTPEPGAELRVWQVDEQSGRRAASVFNETLGAEGRFGPETVDANWHLEFEVTPADSNSPVVRYFREPIRRDNAHVYLRTFPSPASVAAAVLGQITFDDETSVVIVFNSSRAFSDKSDTLTLDGRSLLTPDNASPQDTTIALFLFDVDADRKTGSEAPLFGAFPFLAANDEVLLAKPSQSMSVSFNGRRLALPSDPSTKGVLVAVFD